MADKSFNSDKDNAYIENLLSQLRRTLNGDERTGETTSVPPVNQPSDFQSEDVSASDALTENHVLNDTVGKTDAFIAPDAGGDTVADVPKTDAAVNSDARVTLSENQESGRKEDLDTASIPFATASEQITPDCNGNASQDEAVQPSEKPKHEYARTVLPATGRHRGLLVPEEIVSKDVSKPESDFCENTVTAATPVIETAEREDGTFPNDVVPTEEGTTPSVNEEIGDIDDTVSELNRESDNCKSESAPVPDAIQPETADIATQENAGTERITSVWDTLPPLSSFSPAYPNAGSSQTAVPVADATESAGDSEGKEADSLTATDIDDENEPEHGKYTRTRDRIFIEPIESLGGEHANAQIDAWKRELRHSLANIRLRGIFAGVFTFLLFLLEAIPGLRESLLSRLLLTRIPGVAQLIDLQLLLLVCFVGYRPLFRAVGALFEKRIIPETLALVSAVASVAANVVLYLSGSSSHYLTGLVGAVPVLIALLADYCRIVSASCAFRAYSAQGHQTVGKLGTIAENHLLSGAFSDAEAPLMLLETQPAEQVDGFIPSARYRTEHRLFSAVSVVTAFLSALAFMIYLIATHTSYDAVIWNTVTVVCGCLPLSAFALHRFFFTILSARVARERVAVTGEDAVYRYADTRVMTFEDTEAFPAGSVQVNGIKLCGDFQLDKALYLMASVFDTVGGPLNSVFRISTSNMKISDHVTIRSIQDNGIEAQVNGEDVYVGGRSFLESLGVKVFRDGEDEKAEQENSNVLYVAYHARLAVKFYIGYEISTAFEGNIEYYAKHGFTSVILTSDPLLNEKLIDRISYISEYDIRIVKKDVSSVTSEQFVPRTAPLITYGPRKTLRRMPFFFSSYKKAQKIAMCLAYALTGTAAVALPVLIACLNSTTSLTAFLTQVGALLPTVGIALTLLRLNPNK